MQLHDDPTSYAPIATYAYDGDGKRVRSTMGGVTTLYVGGHTQYKIEAGMPITHTLVSYYSSGAQTIAMREKVVGGSNTLYFLLGDHLGSTSATLDDDGVKIADLRYDAWGVQRWSTGTTPTRQRYTGQTQDVETGLYFYGSRYYDPTLARFIQADTLVPNPGTSQSFNRYTYVLNNPVVYKDPNGHAPQYPGDPDPNNAACATDWCWQNRWYRAHGYDYNRAKKVWDIDVDAHFYDEGILLDTLSEAGIKVEGNWEFGELSLAGQGVVDFGKKVGGLSRLKELFQGPVTLHRQSHNPWGMGWNGCDGRVACTSIDSNNVYIYDKTFTTAKSDTFIKGTIVHELAHVISNNNTLVDADLFPYYIWNGLSTAPQLTPYTSEGDPQEYWAEAVAIWVYSDYKRAESSRINDLSTSQIDYINRVLRGWGW